MKRLMLTLPLFALLIILSCGQEKQKSKKREIKSPFKNKESKLYFQKAQDFQNEGDLDSAIFYFNKADKNAPNTAIILHERGLLKSNIKNYNEALLDLDKSIEITSDKSQKEIWYLNRGLVYMEMGKMINACDDWKKSGRLGKSYILEYCN